MKKVLLVSKMTELEYDEYRYGAAVDEYYKREKIDVSKLELNHEYHYKNLERVIASFREHGVNPGIIKKQGMDRRDFKDKRDLIVVVGGDGTFMDVARYILDDTLLFGIKSSPLSVGGHYNASFEDAEQKIDRVLHGEYRIEKRTRVEGTVQNEFTVTDLASNEIFIADVSPQGFSRLEIYLDGKLFNPGGTGFVASTYRGRTGWFENIPIIFKDKEMSARYSAAHKAFGLRPRRVICEEAEFEPGEDSLVRYKVRETSLAGDNYGFDYGILCPGQEIQVVSRIKSDGIVAFDGSKASVPRHRQYNLYYGNIVRVRVSDKPLNVVEFD